MHENRLTSDGLELTLQSNHLGHFLLTTLLLDNSDKTSPSPLRKAAACRIVNVGSCLHRHCPGFNFADPMCEKDYSLFKAYSQSKLANVMFSAELQRRLDAEGLKITSNCVHPGNVITNVTRNLPWLLDRAFHSLEYVMMLVMKTPAMGAYTSINAATEPLLAGVGGKYLVNSR